MTTRRARGSLEVANETIPEALESVLGPGESVWATVPGASGDSLVATDVRLLHLLRPGDGRASWQGWLFEELSEIRPIGGRPGDTPGRFVIHDARRSAPLISFAIDPARREEALQAVTIVQLLIARARRHSRVAHADSLEEAVDDALARARDRTRPVTGATASGEGTTQVPSGASPSVGAEQAMPGSSPPAVRQRSAAPTRRSPR